MIVNPVSGLILIWIVIRISICFEFDLKQQKKFNMIENEW